MDFGETKIDVSSASALSATVSTIDSFEDTVYTYEDYEIAWEVSFDNKGSWDSAGTSSNLLYLTLATPKISPIRHTLIDIGSRHAAGETAEDGVILDVWGKFSTRSVSKVTGEDLHYYERYDCQNYDTDPLLRHEDGQCGSWAQFMNDVNKAQGIDRIDEWVTVGANNDDGFFVKNWDFVGPGQAAAAIQGNVGPYTHMNVMHANGDVIAPNRKGYHWDWSEVNDQAGAAGQSNSNPASLFNLHFFLRYNIAGQDRWFDPSYGVEYVGLTEFQRLQNFEDVAIEGYFSVFNATVDGSVINYDLNRDGAVDGNDVGPTDVYLFRENIGGNLEVGRAYRDI